MRLQENCSPHSKEGKDLNRVLSSGPFLYQTLIQGLQQLWQADKISSHAVKLLEKSPLHVRVL